MSPGVPQGSVLGLTLTDNVMPTTDNVIIAILINCR